MRAVQQCSSGLHSWTWQQYNNLQSSSQQCNGTTNVQYDDGIAIRLLYDPMQVRDVVFELLSRHVMKRAIPDLVLYSRTPVQLYSGGCGWYITLSTHVRVRTVHCDGGQPYVSTSSATEGNLTSVQLVTMQMSTGHRIPPLHAC